MKTIPESFQGFLQQVPLWLLYWFPPGFLWELFPVFFQDSSPDSFNYPTRNPFGDSTRALLRNLSQDYFRDFFRSSFRNSSFWDFFWTSFRKLFRDPERVSSEILSQDSTFICLVTVLEISPEILPGISKDFFWHCCYDFFQIFTKFPEWILSGFLQRFLPDTLHEFLPEFLHEFLSESLQQVLSEFMHSFHYWFLPGLY